MWMSRNVLGGRLWSGFKKVSVILAIGTGNYRESMLDRIVSGVRHGSVCPQRSQVDPGDRKYKRRGHGGRRSSS